MVPYKIKVWLLYSDEPIELDREYLDYGEDWLASEAAKGGARMAAEGFWLSGGELHIFLPPHRISSIEMERINV